MDADQAHVQDLALLRSMTAEVLRDIDANAGRADPLTPRLEALYSIATDISLHLTEASPDIRKRRARGLCRSLSQAIQNNPRIERPIRAFLEGMAQRLSTARPDWVTLVNDLHRTLATKDPDER